MTNQGSVAFKKKVFKYYKKDRNKSVIKTPNAYRQLADELYNYKQFDKAIEAYKKSLAIDGTDAHAYNNLGSCYFSLRQYDLAEEIYFKSHELNPYYYGVYANLAQIQIIYKNNDKAIEYLLQAIACNDSDLNALINLSILHKMKGDDNASLLYAGKACSKNPDSAHAFQNLGNLLFDLRKFDVAIVAYEQAIEKAPNEVGSYLQLGRALYERGNYKAAKHFYDGLGALFPNSDIALRSMMIAPIIASSLEEIDEWTVDLRKNLDHLLVKGPTLPGVPISYSQVSFYAAYYGDNCKSLVQQVAQVFRKTYPILTYTSPHLLEPQKKTPKKKLKIGFISRFFFFHSVLHCFKNIMEGMKDYDWDSFAVHIVPPFGKQEDTLLDPEKIRIHRQPWDPQKQDESLHQLRTLIDSEKPDVLVFTDIGMEATTYFLAFSRLAPVQCILTGHPHTTGIDTVDYFVSGDAWEAPHADERYSEKLVRIKSNVANYVRPTLNPEKSYSRAELGLPEEGNLYLCMQTLFKIHPGMDRIFGEILRRDPNGYIIMTVGNNDAWVKHLTDRFQTTLPDVINRIVVLPWIATQPFFSVMTHSKVMLDTHPFGGGNTILQALSFGIPVVSKPGENLQSRGALGQYTKMGYTKLITKSQDEYIDLAVKLGTDPDYWNTVHNEILEKADALYLQEEATKEHSDFFRAAVNNAPELKNWIRSLNE